MKDISTLLRVVDTLDVHDAQTEQVIGRAVTAARRRDRRRRQVRTVVRAMAPLAAAAAVTAAVMVLGASVSAKAPGAGPVIEPAASTQAPSTQAPSTQAPSTQAPSTARSATGVDPARAKGVTTGRPTEAGTVPLSNDVAVFQLAVLLPGPSDGATVPSSATDSAQGWVRYADTRISVYVLFRSDPDTTCRGLDDGETCSTVTTADGSVVMKRDDPIAGYRSATVVRKDGFMVMVSAQIPDADTTQPLSLDQLAAIASDRGWQPTVSKSFAAKAPGAAIAAVPTEKVPRPTS